MESSSSTAISHLSAAAGGVGITAVAHPLGSKLVGAVGGGRHLSRVHQVEEIHPGCGQSIHRERQVVGIHLVLEPVGRKSRVGEKIAAMEIHRDTLGTRERDPEVVHQLRLGAHLG